MALLFIFAVFSISFGAKQIAFSKVIDVILGKDVDSLEATIIQQRIPRTVFGILICCGNVKKCYTCNHKK